MIVKSWRKGWFAVEVHIPQSWCDLWENLKRCVLIIKVENRSNKCS